LCTVIARHFATETGGFQADQRPINARSTADRHRRARGVIAVSARVIPCHLAMSLGGVSTRSNTTAPAIKHGVRGSHRIPCLRVGGTEDHEQRQVSRRPPQGVCESPKLSNTPYRTQVSLVAAPSSAIHRQHHRLPDRTRVTVPRRHAVVCSPHAVLMHQSLSSVCVSTHSAQDQHPLSTGSAPTQHRVNTHSAHVYQ